MPCYITRTASYLPGPAVENDEIERFIGSLDGEAATKAKILSMNGIVRRHYAQDHLQQKTHDVYGLGSSAAQQCLSEHKETDSVTYLAAGTTYTPLAAPGFASILHLCWPGLGPKIGLPAASGMQPSCPATPMPCRCWLGILR